MAADATAHAPVHRCTDWSKAGPGGNYLGRRVVVSGNAGNGMLAHGLSKPKILVIEDNCLVADALCDLVRDCGCDVAAAVGHVEHGVQFLADRTVDGAVVDINLHGSLSFSICDELQRRNVPFFFLTGHVGRTSIPAEFRDAKLLTKPLDVHQFKSALA